MENDLTILCVTKRIGRPTDFTRNMLALAQHLDASHVLCFDEYVNDLNIRVDVHTDRLKIVIMMSQGYIESILDQAIAHCDTKYILRLDDDERCSPAMVRWLYDRRYREADHWSFPRANLWRRQSELRYIATPPLWPDIQTRLSVKEKAGGRTRIHEPSPFGGGRVAPVYIEHHKFLLYSEADRRAGAARYESLQSGAGTGHFVAFSVPEVLGEFDLRSLGDGTVV